MAIITINKGYHNQSLYSQINEYDTIILNKTTDVYDWLTKKLLPPLVALEMYNGERYILEDQSYTDELTDYRVMPLQIRQLRSPESKPGTISLINFFP